MDKRMAERLKIEVNAYGESRTVAEILSHLTDMEIQDTFEPILEDLLQEGDI